MLHKHAHEVFVVDSRVFLVVVFTHRMKCLTRNAVSKLHVLNCPPTFVAFILNILASNETSLSLKLTHEEKNCLRRHG